MSQLTIFSQPSTDCQLSVIHNDDQVSTECRPSIDRDVDQVSIKISIKCQSRVSIDTQLQMPSHDSAF